MIERVVSLRELLEFRPTVVGPCSVPPPHRWLFRGQERSTWNLKPTIEHEPSVRSTRDNEALLLGDFKTHAQWLLENVPSFDDVPSWLALMRHHGAPTRLLDWSYSLYVALFFACKERPAACEPHAALWAVNTSLIEAEARQRAPCVIADFKAPLDLSGKDHFEALAWYAFDEDANKDLGFKACAYQTDPAKPIGRWKEAWEKARTRAGVQCRFHDLRHTGCTRMLEAGVPFPVLSTLMGWSAATTVRMAKRYGHIGQTALRSAVEAISTGGGNAPRNEENPAGSFDNPFDLKRNAQDSASNFKI
jgi:hypothetical protein